MKRNYKELLNDVTTFIFDVDGVLTDGSVMMMPGQEPIRTLSSRDGYALQLAAKKGYRVVVITGGSSQAVKERLHKLGVVDVFLSSRNKKKVFQEYIETNQINPIHTLYMGDDIPDYEVMQLVGVACSPADAVPEIKAISDYVSLKNGGKGCARDVIEQTLKVQSRWLEDGDCNW